MNISIQVRCPSCDHRGILEVDEKLVSSSPRGITAINVIENIICRHSFVVYIDNNRVVRDSFICDFKIELPQVPSDQSLEPHKLEHPLDIDLIKINLTPSLLAHILKGLYFGKKIIILVNEEFLYHHLITFFEYIIKDTFEMNLHIIPKKEYEDNKKLYKKDLVLDGKEIINDKDNLIDLKKIMIENVIVQKFFAEYDSEKSLILIKNEFQKAYFISKAISDYLNSSKTLDVKALTDYLKEKVQAIKITPYYLRFLFDIVENYFKTKIPYSMKLTLKMLF